MYLNRLCLQCISHLHINMFLYLLFYHFAYLEKKINLFIEKVVPVRHAHTLIVQNIVM